MRKNKIIIICITAAFTMYASVSCKRVTVEPEESAGSGGWIREDLLWDENDKNGQQAGFFLNFIYSYLPDGFNRVSGDFLDAATDDAISSAVNPTIANYTNGRISVSNNPDAYWGRSYEGIRRVNLFLANVDRVPIADDVNVYWKAEARFLRAMFYFELLKRYGGIPLIGDRIFEPGDDMELPRNTYEECVNYIAAECDFVKSRLRAETAISDAQWGKIPRGAALALKCRLFLYAASPLFNGGGIETDPAKKALTGYPSFRPGLYDSVIVAVSELRSFNYYKFHTGTGTAAYRSVFTTRKNFEIILAAQSGLNFSIETANAPVGYAGAAVSNGRTSPTQEFVDAFPNLDGSPYTGGSTNASQYTNRDPRLNAILFVNGTRWLSRDVEVFEGGLDKPNRGGTSVQTKTGYYLKKFMGDFTNGSAYSNQSHNFPIFRYAEIVLNNAEALNETGRTEDAVKELIEIRKRAGIQAGADSRYGIPAGIDADALGELIRNERRIELSFEEHRFWDLRRWKLAEDVLDGYVNGVKILKNPDDTFQFELQPVSRMIFSQKLYHMPIPYSEITKNSRLIQNEGW